MLLFFGKDNLYVWEKLEGMVYENEGVLFLKELIVGENLDFSEIKEGKIDFIVVCDGLLKIDVDVFFDLNCVGEIMMVIFYNNFIVNKGLKVVGIRVIFLVIDEKKLEDVKKVVGNRKIVNVVFFKFKKVGIVIIGNEVFYSRIVDKFGFVIEEKVKGFGCEVIG